MTARTAGGSTGPPDVPAPVRLAEFTVRSHEITAAGIASVPAICGWLQEAAGLHARDLGVSAYQLLESGRMWVLSRLRLRIAQYPVWDDTVRVRTWPSGRDRLFAYRNFRMTNGNGRSIGAAASAWLVLDTERRRPVRVDRELADFPLLDEAALDEPIEKIRPFTGSDARIERSVRFEDIDVNRHANNIAYVRWMLSGVPDAFRMTHAAIAVDIDYIAEVFSEETVSVESVRTEEAGATRFRHRIVRPEDGAELVRGLTRWRSRRPPEVPGGGRQ